MNYKNIDLYLNYQNKLFLEEIKKSKIKINLFPKIIFYFIDFSLIFKRRKLF